MADETFEVMTDKFRGREIGNTFIIIIIIMCSDTSNKQEDVTISSLYRLIRLLSPQTTQPVFFFYEYHVQASNRAM
jgi:hypothetical protein